MNHPDPHSDGVLNWNNRRTFLGMALLVNAGVVAVSLVASWFSGIVLWERLGWTTAGVVWGIAATLPLLGVFAVTYYLDWRPLRRVRDLVIQLLGPPLLACHWYDVILLAVLAGFCEETLFRGVLQPWMAGVHAGDPTSLGFLVALVGSNLLFALLHPVTPTYAVLVGVIGCYLGLVGLVDPLPESRQGNLLVPVVAHGLYDYLAFLVIIRESRRALQDGTRA